MRNVVAFIVGLLVVASAHAQFPSFGGWQGGNYNGPNTGSDYRGSEARSRQAVTLGTVADLREVRLTSRRTGDGGNAIGAAVGGALGAIAGSQVGEGTGRAAAQIILGLAGAWGGSRVAERIDTIEEDGLEIVVELEGGRMVAVTQALDADSASLRIGDTVRLVEGRLIRVARHTGRVPASTARQSGYF